MDEVSVRGEICSRVDLGNSMHVAIINVTAVQNVQVTVTLDPTGCRVHCRMNIAMHAALCCSQVSNFNRISQCVSNGYLAQRLVS